MKRNPFKYGVVVTGGDFVGREEEMKTLRGEVLSGKSVVLYSPRRLGKTSLLKEFIDRSGDEIIPVFVDLYGLTTKEELARQLLNGVIRESYSTLEKVRDALVKHLSRLGPRVSLTAAGVLSMEFEMRVAMEDDALEEVLDFPQKVAGEKKKRMMVVFDEFQEIAGMNGLALEKRMRSKFQLHRDVSYVFAGSREHILRQMFDEESRAFFEFCRPMSLGPIPREEFSGFIGDKFRATGGRPADEAIGAILTYTGCHPHFTQHLCHEIWFNTRSPKKAQVIEEAVEQIIAQQSSGFERLWDGLRSRNQRALLKGIAIEGGFNYSTEFIGRYTLGSQSQLQKSAGLLKNKAILDDEGKIINIFFREWILRRLVRA